MSLIVINFPSDKKEIAIKFANQIGMVSGHIHRHSCSQGSNNYKLVAPRVLKPTQKKFVVAVFDRAITNLFADEHERDLSTKTLKQCHTTWYQQTAKQLGKEQLNTAIVSAASTILN